jgi:hypothetical protein
MDVGFVDAATCEDVFILGAGFGFPDACRMPNA